MKKIHFLLVALMLLAALFVFGGCGGDGNSRRGGDLLSFDVIATATFEQMQVSFDALMKTSNDEIAQVEVVALGAAKSDWTDGLKWVMLCLTEINTVAAKERRALGGVSGVKMTYTTTNIYGDIVSADAAVFVPNNLWESAEVPMLVIQHPTEVLRKNSPSKLAHFKYYSITDDAAQAQMYIAWILAGSGYIVVIPDYLGLGDNKDTHPYCHESIGDSVIDAVMAAADLKVETKLTYPSKWDTKKLVLMGFSEGGYATMVAAKQLQEGVSVNGKRIPVTAVSPLSGPYSVSGTMRDVMLTAGRDFASPYFMPYVLNAYSEAYSDTVPQASFRRSVIPSVTGRRDYPKALLDAMDGYHTSDFINDLMIVPLSPDDYAGPRSILTNEFLSLLSDDKSVIVKILAENNAFAGWKPNMPMKMFHHVSDDLVPIGNMHAAKAAFGDNAEAASFKDYTNAGGPTWHGRSFLIAFMKGFYYLDYYVYGPRLTKIDDNN